MRPPKGSIICLVAICAGLVFTCLVSGQAPDAAAAANGAAVFERECASCHARESANAPVPGPDVLRQLAPDAIVTALTSGRMRVQGDRLSEAERRAVAEFLAGRSLPAPASLPASDRCASTPAMPAVLQGPAWNGWGAGLSSTRYQQAAAASLAAADVPKLKLKWSFGFAGALAARTQPSVVAGRVFTGSERGAAEESCYAAQGGAVTVIPGVVFSGGSDGGLRAYATRDGTLLWQVDTNREFQTVNGVKANGATIDGAGPVVVGGMLFVSSGYNGIVGRAGNVLLAFQVD